MARTIEHVVAAVPPELAGKVRADRRYRAHCVALTEEECADGARRHALALPFFEVCQGADIRPAAVDGIDLPPPLNLGGRGRRQRLTNQAAGDRSRGDAQ